MSQRFVLWVCGFRCLGANNWALLYRFPRGIFRSRSIARAVVDEIEMSGSSNEPCMSKSGGVSTKVCSATAASPS